MLLADSNQKHVLYSKIYAQRININLQQFLNNYSVCTGTVIDNGIVDYHAELENNECDITHKLTC